MTHPKRIVVVNGHPDPAAEHLCAALAEAYARGASAAGHEVVRLDVGALDFPLIRSLKDYQTAVTPPDIVRAQDVVKHAEHLVFVFPIWFGAPPAVLKGFFEQLLRTGYSLSSPQAAMSSLLTGKSARLMVTMGMPGSVFRFLLGGHGVASLEKGLFLVTGVSPVRRTLFGSAQHPKAGKVAQWLSDAEALGRQGQ